MLSRCKYSPRPLQALSVGASRGLSVVPNIALSLVSEERFSITARLIVEFHDELLELRAMFNDFVESQGQRVEFSVEQGARACKQPRSWLRRPDEEDVT